MLVFEVYVVDGVRGFLFVFVKESVVFTLVVGVVELTFGDYGFGLDAGLNEGDGIGKAFAEFLEVFFVQEEFVFVDVKFTCIIVENTTAFSDGNKFVTSTGYRSYHPRQS